MKSLSAYSAIPISKSVSEIELLQARLYFIRKHHPRIVLPDGAINHLNVVRKSIAS